MSALEATDLTTSHLETDRVANVLGGPRVLGRRVASSFDAHELLTSGLPGGALHHLLARFPALGRPDLLTLALGMTVRTWQRRKDLPDKPLTPEQSNRLWKFAEILVKATDLMGDDAAGLEWLMKPAVAFGRQRPIDLLETAAGTEMVERLIGQLTHGVYV